MSSSDFNSDNEQEPLYESEYEQDDENDEKIILNNDEYCLCDYDSINLIIDKNSKKISDYTNLSVNKSNCLLKINEWNEDKIMEYETINETIDETIIVINNDFKCNICLDNYNFGYSLSCNHIFCKECYNEYLNDKIMDVYSCLSITCPEYKCKTFISENVLKYIIDENKWNIYKRHIIQNYILKHSKTMKYCPQNDCNTISIGNYYTKTITCDCTYKYCFKCHNISHYPASCQEYQNWIGNVEISVSNETWMIAHTKLCPNCKVNIEKNNGCNHMTCKNCKYEFCWLCFCKWKSNHTTDECKENKKNIQYDEEKVKNAIIEVNKLNHYNELISNVNKKIQNIKNDVDLINFYNFIKNSYIFEIYNSSSKKEIFNFYLKNINDMVQILESIVIDKDNISDFEPVFKRKKLIKSIYETMDYIIKDL